VAERRERLQKILAAAGLGSRRACEAIIRQGRVTVNGRQAQLGESADPAHDDIRVDGVRVHFKPTHTYVALYKPAGVISTLSDERGRTTVRDLVPLPGHLVPVGRLDADSEGLMILTDDGELTNRLTHPRYEPVKEYHVCVAGRPDAATLARWRHGVDLPDWDSRTRDGGRTAPAKVGVLHSEDDHPRRSGAGGHAASTWLRVVIHEGRKRQIRRVAQLLGHPVLRLIRVRIGPLELGNLKPGEWRHLTDGQVKQLKESASTRSPAQGRKAKDEDHSPVVVRRPSTERS